RGASPARRRRLYQGNFPRRLAAPPIRRGESDCLSASETPHGVAGATLRASLHWLAPFDTLGWHRSRDSPGLRGIAVFSYSSTSAAIGEIRAARSDGSMQAANETEPSRVAAPARVAPPGAGTWTSTAGIARPVSQARARRGTVPAASRRR